MKNRKYNQLKRNPIVRFIRGIIRLFKKIFRPKRNTSRASHYYYSHEEADRLTPSAGIAEIDDRRDLNPNQSSTFGEIDSLEIDDRNADNFIEAPIVPSIESLAIDDYNAVNFIEALVVPSIESPDIDDRNAINFSESRLEPWTGVAEIDDDRHNLKLMTVGELFQRVKWQHPQIKVSSTPNNSPKNAALN